MSKKGHVKISDEDDVIDDPGHQIISSHVIGHGLPTEDSEEMAADPSKLFDTGAEMALGNVLLDRYTSYAHILKWFGSGFSESTFHKLQKAKRSMHDWPPESYQLEPGEELDVFLSYRGSSGRWWLFCTVVAHENIKAAFVMLIAVFPAIALAIYICAPEAVYTASTYLLSVVTFDLYATRRSFFNFVWPSRRTYFIFIPYGSVIFCLVLWFYNPIITWFTKSKKVWFDKYCVHQSDDSTQAVGLVRVPAYLKCSKKLICVFDSEYVNRLWCIFELAVYMQVRPNPDVEFINTAQKTCEIIMLTWRVFTFCVLCVITRIERGSLDEHTTKEDGSFYLWYRFFDSVMWYTLLFILGQRWFLDCISLREAITTYDVRDAKLSEEDDREVLLQYINHQWGDDDSGQEGLEDFNQHIRNNVERSLPIKGPRSWKLFSYWGACLMLAPFALVEYDSWAYHAIFNDEVELSVDPTAFTNIGFPDRPGGGYIYNPNDFQVRTQKLFNRTPQPIPAVADNPESSEFKDYAGLVVTHYKSDGDDVQVNDPKDLFAGCSQDNPHVNEANHDVGACYHIRVSLCTPEIARPGPARGTVKSGEALENHVKAFEANVAGDYARVSPLTGKNYKWYDDLDIANNKDKTCDDFLPTPVHRTDVVSLFFTDFWQGFTTLASMAVRLLVMRPMAVYVLGVEIRFFLYLQQLTKLSYWIGVAIFLPFYLFLEAVLDWRIAIWFNLRNLASLSVGSDNIQVAHASYAVSWYTNAGPHPTDMSMNVIQEAAAYNAGIRNFDANSVYDTLWWIVIWRPFWGVFHLIHYYSGGCAIKNVIRPSWSDYPDIYINRCVTTSLSEEWKAEHPACTAKNCQDDRATQYMYYDGTTATATHINKSYHSSFPWTWWMSVLFWVFCIIPFCLCWRKTK